VHGKKVCTLKSDSYKNKSLTVSGASFLTHKVTIILIRVLNGYHPAKAFKDPDTTCSLKFAVCK